jgi:chromosome segregation ATPase
MSTRVKKRDKGKDVVPDDNTALTDDALDIFRDQAKELFSRQQHRVDALESDLTRQIESAISEIKNSHASVEEREEHFYKLDEKLAKLSAERDRAVSARKDAEGLLDEARTAIAQVSHEQHDLRVQLSKCHRQLNSRADELKELRERLKNSADGHAEDATIELKELQAERDSLLEELRETQEELIAGGGGSSTDSEELDDLRQRFETAVQEIRGLKAINGDLSDRLAAGPVQQDTDSQTGFDWEAQKRSLMMQLDSEFDDSDSQQASDKLTVEGTIRITDQVIADKDAEIDELKQLLDNQSSNIGDVAVGAAAIAEFLDQDELISQERESLVRMQEEWRDKLRQAEIDISVERARLGRERMELQSQLQSIEQQRPHNDNSDADSTDDKKPAGRWRKRLGLKDD